MDSRCRVIGGRCNLVDTDEIKPDKLRSVTTGGTSRFVVQWGMSLSSEKKQTFKSCVCFPVLDNLPMDHNFLYIYMCRMYIRFSDTPVCPRRWVHLGLVASLIVMILREFMMCNSTFFGVRMPTSMNPQMAYVPNKSHVSWGKKHGPRYEMFHGPKLRKPQFFLIAY